MASFFGIKQVNNLKKVQTENWQLRTDFQEIIVDGWSITLYDFQCMVWFGTCRFVPIPYFRDQWMIESLSQPMSAALVCNIFQPNLWNFTFTVSHQKITIIVTDQNLQRIKTILTLELSQYSNCKHSSNSS